MAGFALSDRETASGRPGSHSCNRDTKSFPNICPSGWDVVARPLSDATRVYTLHLVSCNGDFTKYGTINVKHDLNGRVFRGLSVANFFEASREGAVRGQVIHGASTGRTGRSFSGACGVSFSGRGDGSGIGAGAVRRSDVRVSRGSDTGRGGDAGGAGLTRRRKRQSMRRRCAARGGDGKKKKLRTRGRRPELRGRVGKLVPGGAVTNVRKAPRGVVFISGTARRRATCSR